MKIFRFVKRILVVIILVGGYKIAQAEFKDNFKGKLKVDRQEGIKGWNYYTGDGQATIDFKSGDQDFATINIDATNDKRNIWWALIKRYVSADIDLQELTKPDREIRLEARIRISDAPRRVNLSVNTQRTINYHTNLMEFYIPDTMKWHKISFTTREFNAEPGDSVYAQMALMDWGLKKYQVDIDYYKAKVVNINEDQDQYGIDMPYHPPIPELDVFNKHIPVKKDVTLSKKFPDKNYNNWYTVDKADTIPLISVSQDRTSILEWNFKGYSKDKIARSGLLELNTYSVERSSEFVEESGMIRVSEILEGKSNWKEEKITYNEFLGNNPIEQVINSQMIIDVEVNENQQGKTLITIPKYVLQRMVEGKTRGLAIEPLGLINASFYSSESKKSKLRPKLYIKYSE